MKLNRVASLGLAAALAVIGCKENKQVDETRSKVAATAQASASATSSATTSASTTPKPEYCPPEMVKVPGVVCIDRYEASLYDVDDKGRASPYYYPHNYFVKNRFKFYTEGSKEADAGPPKTKFKMGIPKPPAWQLEGNFKVKALPIKGQRPNAYLSAIAAEKACENVDKRLCTEKEWVTACKGENNTKFPYGNEYEDGACNVAQKGWAPLILHGATAAHLDDPRLILLPLKKPFIEKTGSRAKCVSKFGDDGVYDMVGNLQEWIADQNGVFTGGFSNLPSKEGCDEKETAHKRPYIDYSLGSRCCADLYDKPQPAKALPKAEPDKTAMAPVTPRWPIVCFPKEVSLPGVTTLPREAWGAKPADNAILGAMPNCDNSSPKKITIHHTGEGSITKPGQEKMRLRSAQLAHMKFKGWGDIAYHYGIGLDGRIYALRNPAFRGDSNTLYYPGQNRSHTPEGHILIAIIGNYQKQNMTAETRVALSRLIVAVRNKHGLSSSDVIGHNKVAYTGCPGKNVIKWLNDFGKPPKKDTPELLPTPSSSALPSSVPHQSPPDSPYQQL